MKTKHPKILITTGFLLILSALLLWGIVLLAINEGDPGLAIVVFVGVLLGVLDLVAAAGVFVVKRWGMWLTVVISVCDLFVAISGAVLTDPSLRKVLCIVLMALSVLVIVLTVLPSARQSSGTSSALSGEKTN
jgi:uncharacterized membrane protein (DUF2068 family)